MGTIKMTMSEHFYEMFFEVGPALTQIFRMGYLPAEDEFYELTPEMYEKYYAEVEETDKRVFMILPKNPMYQKSSREIEVVTENQIEWFKKAGDVIERYCRESGKTFKDFEEKLTYCAGIMPEVFSSGSKIRRNLLYEVKADIS
ncbi:MAG: hypothetical protein LBD96_08085 [Treponema sp.]|jgi:hypothetical protein|nr:hypothetical protein [Treponema sp.]